MSLRCEIDIDNLSIQGGNIFHPKHVRWQTFFHTKFASILNVRDNSQKNLQVIEFSYKCHKRCTLNKSKPYSTQCINFTLSIICGWVNKPNIGKRGFVVLQFWHNSISTTDHITKTKPNQLFKALGSIIQLSKHYYKMWVQLINPHSLDQ